MASSVLTAVKRALKSYDNQTATAEETVETLSVLKLVFESLDDEDLPSTPKPKPKPKPKPVVYLPQEPISLRLVSAERKPKGGCEIALKSGASIQAAAGAMVGGAPERMIKTAAMWLQTPAHPFLCLVDPRSQAIIAGAAVVPELPYTAEDPSIQTFEDIGKVIDTLDSDTIAFPTFHLAALLMPTKASTTAIANTRLFTSANRSIPVSTFLSAGNNAKLRLKRISAISSASELMSKFYAENIDEIDTAVGAAWKEYMDGVPHEPMTLSVLDKIRRVSQYGPKSAVSGDLATMRDLYCSTPQQFGLFLWAATGMAPGFAPFALKSPITSGSYLKKFHTNTQDLLKPIKAKTVDLELAAARYDFKDIPTKLLTGTPPPLLRLGEATQETYAKDQFLFQRKHDGARATVHVWGKDGTAWIFSKNGRRVFNTTWNSYVPDLERQLQLTVFGPRKVRDCIFDGELVTYDSDDNEMGLGAAIYDPSRVAKIRFVAFDCLVDSGRDVTDKGAADRLNRLQRLLGTSISSDWCRVSADLSTFKKWNNLKEYAIASQWEGLVVKDRNSPYVAGRSKVALRWKARNIKTVRTYKTENPFVRSLEPVDGIVMFVGLTNGNDTDVAVGMKVDMNTGRVLQEDSDRLFYESVTAANVATLQNRYKVFGDPATIPAQVETGQPHGLVAAKNETDEWVVISALEAESKGFKMYPLVPSLKKNRTVRESDVYVLMTGDTLSNAVEVKFTINVAAACVKMKKGQSKLKVIGPDGKDADQSSKLCDGDHLVVVEKKNEFLLPPIFESTANRSNKIRINNTYYDTTDYTTTTTITNQPLIPIAQHLKITHEAFSLVLLPRDI
ncbi:MAG: hypothetical protein ACPGR8_01105 [Limisphaerales bacterium]